MDKNTASSSLEVFADISGAYSFSPKNFRRLALEGRIFEDPTYSRVVFLKNQQQPRGS